ncbi:MAG: tRNA (adenosine(37)-N6)-threonylcarbamoyltransferase complex ATPase subunit type 1 TsaE [Deltaproteobacteria bacterium]|nr:tRNA (adenosine(37)-N6)-threonylcarbamoyltransferase complex ATPase subunit type 1 TsaE [Deltaproteobacteria bacterium]
MTKVELISNNVDDTINIGVVIGRNLREGDVVALIGDLGSGKTCIAGGIARGLGVSGDFCVTSPTFTLVNEYSGRIPFYHLDLYRLAGPEDLEDLGYEEYFFGRGVAVVEWAEKIDDIIPSDSIFIHLKHHDERKRKIAISCKGDNGREIIKKISKEASSEWL